MTLPYGFVEEGVYFERLSPDVETETPTVGTVYAYEGYIKGHRYAAALAIDDTCDDEVVEALWRALRRAAAYTVQHV